MTSPRGEINREADGGRTLVFRRRFPHPVEDVWSAVTESERLARSAARTWRIALTLSEEGGTTTLLFEQTVPADMDVTDVGPGWHWYLDRLDASLAGSPMPDWNDYHPALKSA